MTIQSNRLSVRRSAGPRIAVILVALMIPASEQVEAQSDCTIEQPGHAFLTANAARARLAASKVLFWPASGEWGYDVPAGSGIRVIYFANLMLAGRIDGEIRSISTETDDMWPGPLDLNGKPPTDCNDWNRVFKITRQDIADYDASGEAGPALLDWPWEAGAPVVDGDGIDGNYDLSAGDRPELLGHETGWWVLNDLGGNDETQRKPLGVEIQVTGFAAGSDDPAVDYATLFRFHITHRGEGPITDAYFGMWVDPDVGEPGDDFIGSDTTLGLAYAYNGNDYDGVEGLITHPRSYGDRPAAIGVAILDGILVDNDGIDNDTDGVVDEDDERLRMSKFVSWQSGENPADPEQDYRYLTGFWWDGVPFTFGGRGRSFSVTPVDFLYPGEPPAFWSEESPYGSGERNGPGERRFLWSTGPFSMEVGESRELVVAFLWARGDDRFDSIRKLKRAVPQIRDVWEQGFEILPPTPPSVTPELLAPGQGATNQPPILSLTWRALPDGQRSEVHISHDQQFSTFVDRFVTDGTTADLDVAEDSTYFWRVRAINAGGEGPWSSVRSFSTGAIQPVAPGPLDISGSETWAFIQVQGVSSDDACGPDASSNFGCQQVGGNFVYGSFNGRTDWVMYHTGDGPESSLGRFAPHDFELRFTELGSYGYHAQTTGRVVHVPFEAWDIGAVGPFGVNDPLDDEQLIPGLYSDAGEECPFAFRETVDDPFGFEWPSTDRIYAYYPTRGASYGDWQSGVVPLVELDPEGCPTLGDADPARRIVDFTRRPLQGLVFFMDPDSPDHRSEGIPVGNVVRFLTTKPVPPIPSSPAHDELFGSVSALDVPLWWNTPSRFVRTRVQVADNPGFSPVLIDSLVSGSNLTAPNLPFGQYHWRVGYDSDQPMWSETWSFLVASTVATEDLGEFPRSLTLSSPFPNPVGDFAHFDLGLPEAGHVRVTAYDLLGRRVAIVSDDLMTAGWHTVRWDSRSIGSGVYVVRLQAGKTAITTKVVVVK